MKTLLLAAHVFPMCSAPIVQGGVLFDGDRVLAVGEGKALKDAADDAQLVELGDAAVLPGLINAHVHLELTNVVRPEPAPANFVDWILALLWQLAGVDNAAEFARRSAEAGIEQCLRFGVTSVGDVTLNPLVTRPLLRASGMRGVSFGEVLGMAGRSGQFEGRLSAAMDRSQETPWLRAGIEPHAPYSVDLRFYRRCVEEARRAGMPLASHLAETEDESKFLTHHQGEFRRLWEALGAWQVGVSRDEGGPVRAMKRVGLLDHVPSVLAHVNHVDDEELEILAGSKASVVYCPRTHAYFKHPPHRFLDMIARGINVAIGTDSCASSSDLNLLDDLRLVRRLHPQMQARLLFEMVTTHAAKALGMGGQVGCLAPGAWADFCVFSAAGDDPLADILESDSPPRQVWIGGVRRR